MQGQRTYEAILNGGPFRYDKDGSVFGNRERLLPSARRGHYREYTVSTPGSRDRGARRIVRRREANGTRGLLVHGGPLREFQTDHAMSDDNDLSGAPKRPEEMMMTMERPAEMTLSLRAVRPNIVQSIRAFRVSDLQDAANAAGQHFLYANLGNAQTKQDVLDLIAQQFTFPAHFGKNFDALYDCMTDPLHKSGPQPGFVIVLEQIPANGKFDKEAREQLLDIFRDASDYWGDRKVPFRCFYSFL